jgi:hypothetical protein
MEIFCLHGNEEDKILLELNEVLGFPDRTSFEGGYDIICSLQIDVGCYHVKHGNLYSATGALYRFSNELKNCYQNLKGQAEYRLRLENDLFFALAMTSSGHAEVSGTFRERPDKKNILHFIMNTDQTCFLQVIQSIDELKKTYGDMQGIGK